MARYGHDPVPDPDEEPSAEWGWHGTFPWGIRIAGLLTVVALVAMMWPRDQALGQTHLFWLALPAVLVLVGVLRRNRSRRTTGRARAGTARSRSRARRAG